MSDAIIITPIQESILAIRANIYDPNAKKIIVVESLPRIHEASDAPDADLAFTMLDGDYWRFIDDEWAKIPTQFDDDTLAGFLGSGDIIRASIIAIDRLLVRIDPTEYLHSGNAGGQSLAFASLAEIVQFYKDLKQTLKDREALENGLTTGKYFKTPKYAVGGVIEGDE
jgi:hypothetical protein